jgi:hypothetical protein
VLRPRARVLEPRSFAKACVASLPIGVPGAIQQWLDHEPVVRADGLLVPDAIGVLPLGRTEGHQEAKSLVVGHLGLLVGRLDVLPEGVVESLMTAARSFQYALIGSQKSLPMPST